jgi:hypothetical protein
MYLSAICGSGLTLAPLQATSRTCAYLAPCSLQCRETCPFRCQFGFHDLKVGKVGCCELFIYGKDAITRT